MKKNKYKYVYDLIVIVIFFFICYFYFSNASYIRNLDGDIAAAYNIFSGIARTINSGEIPLWDPYMWGGMTAVGNPVSEAMYPITYILCKLLYNAEIGQLSYSIMIYSTFIHVCILMIGFYALGISIGCSRYSSTVIAVIASFSGCAFQSHGWAYIYSGIVYIPLFLAMLMNITQKNKYSRIIMVLLCSIIFGITGLASTSHGILFMIIAFAVFYFVYIYSIRFDKKEIIRFTVECTIITVLGIAIMSPSLLSFIDFLQNSYRTLDGGGVTSGISSKMTYDTFTTFVVDDSARSSIINSYYGWFAIGNCLPLFLIIGLIKKKDKPKHLYYVGIILALIGFMTPYAIVFNKILYFIPFINAIREPFLYSTIFVIGIVILSLYGVKQFEKGIIEKERVQVEDIYIILSIIVLSINIVVPNNYNYSYIIYYFIIVFIYILNGHFRRAHMVSIISLIVIGLAVMCHEFYWFDYWNNVAEYNMDSASRKVQSVNESIISIIPDEDDEIGYRVIKMIGDTAYSADIMSSLGIMDANAYMNPMLDNMANVVNNWSLEKRMQMQNIKYYITTEDNCMDLNDNYSYIGEQNVYNLYDTDEKIVDRIYEYNNRKGNLWPVSSVYYCNQDINEFNDIINQDSFDIFDDALLYDSTGENKTVEYGKNVEIELLDYSTNKITWNIKVNDDKAFLVSSEIYANGWTAYLNNNKADIKEVNTAFRGVEVFKGEYVLEFVYMPLTYIIGKILQYIALINIIIAIIICCAINWKNSYKNNII